jgi:hypothetical protein
VGRRRKNDRNIEIKKRGEYAERTQRRMRKTCRKKEGELEGKAGEICGKKGQIRRDRR